ncbi:carboxypeptidase-like regulatory domain-containing protein [Mucilaginibacter sp.]|uniref:carboxypeptidase-like regulatory domain-containing protein n=1 Tax=Mucilaginibacter sp. TaxID=1882438 RepID=UPI0026017351|nr:carboxypeptidase-like regulatory domain-containing protein [Mucilaginibacter sp.]MDB4918419.1 hypothetical protein [Mucilaginibacter sp.]
MKIINFFFYMLLLCTTCFSQTISITGTIKDQQGQPVPLAFVRDGQHFYATFADSTGAFILMADPASSLIAIAPGYSDANVKIDGKRSIAVVMTKGGSSSAGNSNTSASSSQTQNIIDFLNSQPVSNQTGYSQKVQEGFNQEPTRGSRYLFNNWVHGFATGTGDSLLYDANNLYNYDKMDGDILFTRDKVSVFRIDKAHIKTISLYTGEPYPLTFENAPAVYNKPFVQVLVSSPKYRVYKRTETKLVRANFHTDGVIESGHKYDEYTDEAKYYFVKLPDGQPQSISLKKSTIKKLFGGDADKFIAAHGGKDIDDSYLRDLNYNLSQ